MPRHDTTKKKYDEVSEDIFHDLPDKLKEHPPESIRRLSSDMFQVSMTKLIIKELKLLLHYAVDI